MKILQVIKTGWNKFWTWFKKIREKFPLAKILAVAIILIMAVADYYTMFNYFRDGAGFVPDDSRLYALVMALALEGVPTYLGVANSERRDKSRYPVLDKDINDIGSRFAMAVTTVAIGLAIVLRIGMMYNQWLMDELSFEEDITYALGQCFLVVSPALTSLTAYVVSWFAFRSSYLKKCEKEMAAAEEEFLRRQREYQKARQACKECQDSLCAALGMEDPPDRYDEFRLESFHRIRAKLVDNCIVAYPTQIERYTSEVEQALSNYIIEMSRHTTVPDEILQIKVSDIIRKYEETNRNYADAWDYDLSGPDLERELRRTLDTSVVRAQFKAGLNHSKL